MALYSALGLNSTLKTFLNVPCADTWRRLTKDHELLGWSRQNDQFHSILDHHANASSRGRRFLRGKFELQYRTRVIHGMDGIFDHLIMKFRALATKVGAESFQGFPMMLQLSTSH